MKIFFEEELPVSEKIIRIMEKAADYCVASEKLDSNRTEISVTFADSDEIKTLNREYRGKDSVTDVLSFPQFNSIDELPDEGDICLGDVVICREKAGEQAAALGHSFEREIIYLFVHSVFHLLGYDHMEKSDKEEMRRREEEAMEYLKIGRKI